MSTQFYIFMKIIKNKRGNRTWTYWTLYKKHYILNILCIFPHYKQPRTRIFFLFFLCPLLHGFFQLSSLIPVDIQHVYRYAQRKQQFDEWKEESANPATGSFVRHMVATWEITCIQRRIVDLPNGPLHRCIGFLLSP